MFSSRHNTVDLTDDSFPCSPSESTPHLDSGVLSDPEYGTTGKPPTYKSMVDNRVREQPLPSRILKPRTAFWKECVTSYLGLSRSQKRPADDTEEFDDHRAASRRRIESPDRLIDENPEKPSEIQFQLDAALERAKILEEQGALREASWTTKYSKIVQKHNAVVQRFEEEHQLLEESSSRQKHLQRELKQCRELLDVRTKELSGAQAFLTAKDSYTASDISHLVEQLNSNISQLSATITETVISQTDSSILLPFDGDLPDSNEGALEEWRENIGHFLHVDLIYWIRTQRKNDLFEAIVQSAFQAALVSQCVYLIQRWGMEDDSDTEILLNLYASMQRKEVVAVVGQWRSLTQNHIQESGDRYDWSEESSHTIFTRFVFVLLLCGASMDTDEIWAWVREQFGDRVREVILSVEKLRKAFANVVSKEFSVTSLGLGVAYDSDLMSDEHEGPRSARKRHTPTGYVLCTTQMGLEWRTQGKSLSGGLVDEEGVLLKPSILLSTSLDAEPEA